MRMPSEDPFTLTQHIEALSQRNKQDFLERMNAAKPVMEEMAKVRPETWQMMKGTFQSLENVGRMGGLGSLVGGLQQGAMMPFRVLGGRMQFAMERLTMPMMTHVNRITNAYESFIMENQTGALQIVPLQRSIY